MRKFQTFIWFLFTASCILFLWSQFNGLKGKERAEESTKPVITCSLDVLSIKSGEWKDSDRLVEGLHAMDSEDGDLTNAIEIEDISKVKDSGVFKVSYRVSDKENNTTYFSRDVILADYSPPIFTIENEPLYIKGETLDIRKYISVKDCIDGDLTDQVEIDYSKVDCVNSGLYPVFLKVSNSIGDTAEYKMFVRVKEKTVNQAAVKLTCYSVRIKRGDDFSVRDYIDEVLNGYGEVMYNPELDIDDEVDTNQPGIYPVTYQLSDYFMDTTAVLMVEITD